MTGDRFSRRENLMEKSEVSGTDTPTIRQTIQLSQSSLAFLPRRGTGKEKGFQRKYGVYIRPRESGIGEQSLPPVRRESFIGSADFRGPSPLIFA